MKRTILFTTAALLAAPLFAADSEVAAAAKKLADSAGYSWKTTVVVPEGSQWRPGPTEGKAQKDGLTQVKMTFGDNTSEMVLKGDKAAVLTQDSGWQSTAELANAEGSGRFAGMMARNFKAPAVQATEIAAAVKELKKDGDAYAGEMTEEGAKTLLAFRRGPAGGDAPTISGAKGSAKFWLKDGVLAKYEFKVQGKVSFNGNDRDVDRATTVEIKDVGTTKVEVPEDAKKKLN